MPRVFTISDLHVDYAENLEHVLSLSEQDFVDDTLIIGGDISDSFEKIATVLIEMKNRFRHVTYVPGNHELWIRNTTLSDSIEKFHKIVELCRQVETHTEPFEVGRGDARVWIVPLFAWYRSSPADPASLYIRKEGEDWPHMPWMDHALCKWPAEFGAAGSDRAAEYFVELNREQVERVYDAPIISFSHFLPRKGLIFGDLDMADRYRRPNAILRSYEGDPYPQFNFSRVAGDLKIDDQVRQLGSAVHIHGHQHRNRNRHIDGVTYISHCLGYSRERRFLGNNRMPLKVWENGVFIAPKETMDG